MAKINSGDDTDQSAASASWLWYFLRSTDDGRSYSVLSR